MVQYRDLVFCLSVCGFIGLSTVATTLQLILLFGSMSPSSFVEFLFVCLCFAEARLTLKCLSIGTPNTTTFPFFPNGKVVVIKCPNI